jgi:hypothetical protein
LDPKILGVALLSTTNAPTVAYIITVYSQVSFISSSNIFFSILSSNNLKITQMDTTKSY